MKQQQQERFLTTFPLLEDLNKEYQDLKYKPIFSYDILSIINTLDYDLYNLSNSTIGEFTPENLSKHIDFLLKTIYDYKNKGRVLLVNNLFKKKKPLPNIPHENSLSFKFKKFITKIYEY